MNSDDLYVPQPHVNPFEGPDGAARLAAYDASRAARWNDIQNHTGAYAPAGDGGFLGFLGNIMEPIMNATIKYGPAIYAAAALGDASGLFGAGAEAGAAGAGASAGEMGLGGTLSNAGLGLENLGFLDSMAPGALGGLGEAAGAAGAAGGLGAGIGDAGIVHITGTAPAAAGLGGPIAAGAAGLAGLGNILGNNPTQPINSDALQNMPGVNQPDVPYPQGSLPPLVIPPLNGMGPVDPTNGAGPGQVGGQGGTPTGGGILGGGIPDWLKDALGLGGGLIAGNVDRIKAQQDSEWWKSQLDQLQGMYKPGTPEAGLMEDKMRAQDAAAGRNSQYGIRATNLAAMLADKRSQIMTSAGYQNMANAYRNRSSQDLNGLFTAMGGQGGIGGVGSSLAGLLGSGITGLQGLFNPTSAPVK